MAGTMITVVALGGWYPRGAARLIEKFYEVSHGYMIVPWINALPPEAPANVVRNGRDYTGYCAKPFALRALRDYGADIGILLDAAFYPIRSINPLVDHITQYGYYLCENGYNVGEWCQDSSLEPLGITREEAFRIPEVSSYCVGLNFHWDSCNRLLDEWCDSWPTFPGPHTNIHRDPETSKGLPDRNAGFCSNDPRVKGHRHDQTALSVIAYRLGFDKRIARPKFTAYCGTETKETVLVNRGGL